ncbi:MAG TPA: diaminopimelate epimerase [bacterium]|nr:diaminopimelate epimerase [bacterium]
MTGNPFGMNQNHFVKSHALGNDYIVVDPQALSFSLTERAIQQICDRHTGVGSDGILALAPSSRADFGLRIFNPDGSEAEKSGNGLRIFARYLYDHGWTTKSRFTVETPGGLVRIELHLRGRDVEDITVEMGPVTFRSDQIPVTGPPRDVVDERMEVDGELFTVTAVSVGNPHCVVFVHDLVRVDVPRWGPRLERHVAFPNRINVQFAQVRSRDRVAARIWERGAGETMASGSSACAVAAASVRKGLTDRAVTITMPGGELRVEVGADWSLTLSGPAVEVYEGTLNEGFVSLLRG